jgi:hypothetical protein
VQFAICDLPIRAGSQLSPIFRRLARRMARLQDDLSDNTIPFVLDMDGEVVESSTRQEPALLQVLAAGARAPP